MSSNNFHFNNVVIVCGPVIIENNKVLLNKHGEKPIWKFPGGDVTEASGSLETWAAIKVKEEMGLEVEIIKALNPMVIWQADETILLFHYLAKTKTQEIAPAKYIKEYAWHDIDNLPADVAPNIKPIIEEYKKL
ncbi:MAG: NUDIX domain-containing protein [Candidatus Buchananbacteria bacterium]